MSADLRNSDEWLKDPAFVDFRVVDPDGWDRKNFAKSWAEKISREEFQLRLLASTVLRKRKPC